MPLRLQKSNRRWTQIFKKSHLLERSLFRMDVLEAAWKHVGKKGKAAGIDGVRAEDILAEANGDGAEIEHPEGGPARGERSESNPQVRFDVGEQRA